MLRPTLLAALLIGCTLSSGQALAQYYPSDVYRGAPAPGPYDDPRFVDPPGYREPVLPRPPGARVERDAYGVPYPTERYSRGGPPPYADAYPDSVPRPPAGIYPDDRPGPRTSASPPGYDSQDDAAPPRYGRPAYGMQPGYGPPVYAPPPAYGRPPAYGAQPGGPEPAARTPPAVGQGDGRYAALPPDYQPEEGDVKELPSQLKRQLVEYRTK